MTLPPSFESVGLGRDAILGSYCSACESVRKQGRFWRAARSATITLEGTPGLAGTSSSPTLAASLLRKVLADWVGRAIARSPEGSFRCLCGSIRTKCAVCQGVDKGETSRTANSRAGRRRGVKRQVGTRQVESGGSVAPPRAPGHKQASTIDKTRQTTESSKVQTRPRRTCSCEPFRSAAGSSFDPV